MPSSYVDSFAPIVKVLIEHAPLKVVDIGPGWGKYGLACREYLPGLESLHAVEVREGKLPTQEAIYDWVYIGDARDDAYQKRFWSRWDLALMVDIIEHMTIDEGRALLRKLTGAGCHILVATPKEFVEQHDDSNPYETHVSLWGWKSFGGFNIAKDVSTADAIIYLIEP